MTNEPSRSFLENPFVLSKFQVLLGTLVILAYLFLQIPVSP